MLSIKNKKARGLLRFIIPFILIPAIVAFGALMPGEKKYILVSLAIAVLAVVLFICGFERKEIGTRRLVIVSVMTALSVVGRFIPFFKPVTALTVICAIHLGGEAGFMVGAFSALLSNFYFGQGPWTPFQMLAWGLIGLLAGLLARPLKKSRAMLLTYGVISGIAFSAIMDIWTVLWYNGTPELSLYLGALLSALPYTVLYSVSNLIFLLLLARPFGNKLERIKKKYGV